MLPPIGQISKPVKKKKKKIKDLFHGGGGPQVDEVSCLSGVTRVSI